MTAARLPDDAGTPRSLLEVMKLSCTVDLPRIGRLHVTYTADLPGGTARIAVRDNDGQPVHLGELFRRDHQEIAWALCRDLAEQLDELDIKDAARALEEKGPRWRSSPPSVRSGDVEAEVVREGGEVRGLRAGPPLSPEDATPPRGTPRPQPRGGR